MVSILRIDGPCIDPSLSRCQRCSISEEGAVFFLSSRIAFDLTSEQADCGIAVQGASDAARSAAVGIAS
jgi:formate dehydrogenase assembly factor FdhD